MMLNDNKLKRKGCKEDTAAIYDPPDKQQHFLNKEDEDFKTEEKKKDVSPNKKPKIGGKVKARYDKDWYTGELVPYNKTLTSGQLR